MSYSTDKTKPITGSTLIRHWPAAFFPRLRGALNESNALARIRQNKPNSTNERSRHHRTERTQPASIRAPAKNPTARALRRFLDFPATFTKQTQFAPKPHEFRIFPLQAAPRPPAPAARRPWPSPALSSKSALRAARLPPHSTRSRTSDPACIPPQSDPAR